MKGVKIDFTAVTTGVLKLIVFGHITKARQSDEAVEMAINRYLNIAPFFDNKFMRLINLYSFLLVFAVVDDHSTGFRLATEFYNNKQALADFTRSAKSTPMTLHI